MKTSKLFRATALIGAMLAGTMLTGCKEDPSVEDPIKDLVGDYLVSESYENGTLSAKFEYNNDNQLGKMAGYGSDGSLISTVSYSYNNKGQLISFAAQSDEDVVTTELTYDNAGRVSHSSVYDGNELVIAYTHTYKNDKITVTGIVDNETTSIHTYITDGNNIIQEEYAIPAMPQLNWVRERSDFDGKKHAEGAFHNVAYLPESSNPRREKMTSGNGLIVFDWRWEYTYNQAGYMTTATNYDVATGEKIDFYEYKLIKAK